MVPAIHFVAIPMETNEYPLSSAQALLLMGSIFLLVGIVVIYSQGGSHFKRIRQYLGATPTASITPDTTGTVSVTGRIQLLEDAVEGPLTGEDCVIAEEEEQALRRDWKYDRQERIEMEQKGTFDEEERQRKITTWHTLSADRDLAPFSIETGSDSVLVDPTGAELDLPVQATEGTSKWRRLLHRFAFIGYLGKYTSIVGNPHRHIERHLAPGDTVVVMGQVLSEDNAEDPAVKLGNGRGRFLITSRSRWNLAVRNLVRGTFVSIPGIISVGLGLALFIGGVWTSGIW